MALEAERAIEAILMVADEPVEPGLLAQLLEVTPARVEEICADLARGYDRNDRGFVLTRVAGGYRFQSHPDLAAYVERFVLEGRTAKLSAAALETLAIVAYKQPVSRAQIAGIRGVNADGVLRSLEQRGYVAEVARDPGPGQAVLYGTTSLLLERLGLDTIDDLPPLAGFVPGPEVMEALEDSLRFDRRTPAGPDTGGGGPASDATEVGSGPDLGAGADGRPAAGSGGADEDLRARVDAENAPGRDEGGIDDFRADDYRIDGFRTVEHDGGDPGSGEPGHGNGADGRDDRAW